MKTTRRQELRTNELSQQIDHVGEYLKDHAATLTAVIVGAVVVIGGGLWYYNHQTSRSNQAWADLMPTEADTDTGLLIERYKSVALAGISPELTRAAWLSVGNTALGELYAAKPDDETTDGQTLDRDELVAIAKDAFQNVISNPGEDLTALGRALIAMGVLEEDEHHFDKARERYAKVVDDPRFENMPFKMEAKFRLDRMSTWSQPIEFPPPPSATVSTGDSSPASMQGSEPVPFDPKIFASKKSSDTDPSTDTESESQPLTPTTQPAEPSESTPATAP